MKISKRHLLLGTALLATGLVLATSASAQTLYVPSGSTGIGNNTTNTNVGIGVPVPLAKLHINGAIRGGYAAGSLEVSTDHGWLAMGPMNGSWAHIQTNMPAFYFNKAITVHGMLSSYQSNDLVLGTYSLPRMIIKHSGKVGIGTQAPAATLSVEAVENQTMLGANTQAAIRIANNYPAAFGRRSELQFGLSQLPNEQLAVIAGEYSSHNGHVGGDLVFGTSPNDANGMLERLRIKHTGNVGIGIINPATKLEVNGTISMVRGNRIQFLETVGGANRAFIEGDAGNQLKFHVGSGSGLDALMIDYAGNVGIGTMNPNEKLTVSGTIYGREVKVDLNVPGPDYVFEPDYNLPSLDSIETYIKANKHLPEVPSAKEMEANGISLSEMNMILLKKVEELTLHLIEQNKKLKTVQDELEQIRREKQ